MTRGRPEKWNHSDSGGKVLCVALVMGVVACEKQVKSGQWPLARQLGSHLAGSEAFGTLHGVKHLPRFNRGV